MRIVAGRYKSRLISMPKGVEIRPTQDRVREAIFNVLADVNGMRVLELFAGTGALGIEALSRGASHVTFVDNNPRCVRTIISNLDSLSVSKDCYDIIRGNAVNIVSKLAKEQAKYDLVFIDPPYHQEMAKNCLIVMDSYDILSRIAQVVVEHFSKDVLAADLKTLVLGKEKKYGDTLISFYRRAQ